MVAVHRIATRVAQDLFFARRRVERVVGRPHAAQMARAERPDVARVGRVPFERFASDKCIAQAVAHIGRFHDILIEEHAVVFQLDRVAVDAAALGAA